MLESSYLSQAIDLNLAIFLSQPSNLMLYYGITEGPDHSKL